MSRAPAALPPELHPEPIPRHLAVIQDGNRRWAKGHRLALLRGHQEGAKATKEIIRACDDFGVEVLTLYAFSTENWSRPRHEVSALMRLIEDNLRKEIDELDEKNTFIRHVGEPGPLPASLRRELARCCERTADNTGMVLNLAINYGGRAEIVRAVRRLAERVKAGELEPAALDEAALDAELYTGGQPDPDLLIRTGGELRISNFLPWQVAYSELWVTSTLWPDFTREELVQSIGDYQKRDRRFGGVSA
ncbi:MAG: isoprenyl transferase [Armatimonadetes bacterium CG_4_10_14_3_um_filter_66_18]|nr:isoprenyl transferase [Armatimonadota bacterium]OIP01087.1 MAG: di-trans,poly-cis-decaprenylcistransferase [Armatimonadetes bacterium CG2_30_66_41]PIU92784.1 MAG: isoprenyl transferase [Armatimonadetes bacterium CG06_land_8_20_14_3_00_66_21]PIX39815.1 MAG: isoprenyl transferase [Armatimonadetes bacterium CG_4_8_14_3_um_filter_66_20]PIY53666.1 MAG: isoprenyl transferase [Armatimonadetes bacterium CG_4_10_14_3_um_filter_66_18]PIZ40946.1 MAG: isoprenyl transferase [Armatimonadetes bacterium CG